MAINLSLYQRWLPGGAEKYRALPASKQDGYAWKALHELGSLEVDELIELRDHGPGLPDPPPFPDPAPRKSSGRARGRPKVSAEPCDQRLLVLLTATQYQGVKARAEAEGLSMGEFVRRALTEVLGQDG